MNYALKKSKIQGIYCTRAINNRGLYSGKTFLVLLCGYYSREVTIQKKLFGTGALLFPSLQLHFTDLIMKVSENSMLTLPNLDSQELDSPNLDTVEFKCNHTTLVRTFETLYLVLHKYLSTRLEMD